MQCSFFLANKKGLKLRYANPKHLFHFVAKIMQSDILKALSIQFQTPKKETRRDLKFQCTFSKKNPFFVKAWTLKILRSSQSNFETKKSHRTLTKLDEQWLFSVARRRRKKGNRKSSTNFNSVQGFCGNFPKTLNSPLIANCYHTANGENFLLTLRCWTA